MEAPPSSSYSPPLQNHTDCSRSDPNGNPTAENRPPPLPAITNRKRTRTKPHRDRDRDASSIGAKSSSSGSTSSISFSRKRARRVGFKFRRPAIRLGSIRRDVGSEVATAALPLGMSFALVINKVLEERDNKNGKISIDNLAEVCTFAVRESLAYVRQTPNFWLTHRMPMVAEVFGEKLDCFVKNFEKSFGCTLRALRPFTEPSAFSGTCSSKQHYRKTTRFRGVMRRPVGCANSEIKESNSEVDSSNSSNMATGSQFDTHGESLATDSLNQELALYQRVNQLTCVLPSTSSAVDELMLSTYERSLVQQVRSNDLKELELKLMMEKIKLAETQVVLNADSNHLKMSELRMDGSKASFKEEKFKNQVEERRYAELQRKCIDCLVAGLFIMVFFLSYGAYNFSYRRISEAASACTIEPEESKSWWMPKRVSSFNSGLQTLKCQFQVMSQMLFGILMILAVAFLVVQRSGSKQTMPITFIILLLAIACGFSGKICIDTLGGSGKHWLFYWEILCLLHFLSTAWTSALFLILHGPVNVSQTTRYSRLLPYWTRRLLFYSAVLLFLPLLSALTPFASLVEWKDHFKQLIVDYFSYSEYRS